MNRLVKHFGSLAKVAQKGGFAESTVKKWVDGTSDPSRARCVQLAQGTGVSLLWLVAGDGEMWPSEAPETAQPSQSQVLSIERLTLALQAVESALAARRATLPAEKRAEAALLVYELLGTGLPEAEVIPIARRAVALAHGQGAGDDGITGTGAGR